MIFRSTPALPSVHCGWQHAVETQHTWQVRQHSEEQGVHPSRPRMVNAHCYNAGKGHRLQNELLLPLRVFLAINTQAYTIECNYSE